MTDMPRPRYLKKDDKGYKLRRPVPKAFQEQVGKSQWVERLSAMTYPEMCERARCFGVETDAQLKSIRNELERAAQPNRGSDEPRFTLSMTELAQLKLIYFRQLEEVIDASGGYASGLGNLSDAEYRDLQSDADIEHHIALQTYSTAQDDYQHGYADGPSEGQRGRHLIAEAALKLLLENGFVRCP